MSKTLMSVLVVGVIAVGGYFVLNKKSSTEQAKVAETETTENTPVQPEGKKMAFSEFIKKGGAYKCTVNQNVNNTTTVGTTYIDGGMIRGEYNTKVSNMSIDSTMIVRDGYTYSWSSALPNMGFKAKVVASEGNGTAPTSGSYSFNAEQIGDYNCESWSVDASKFTIPASITFKDVGAQ